MSEKRLKFTLESDRQYIGILDEGYDLTGFEVCNLLNSLYQQCEALQNENEQLRQQVQNAKEVAVENDVQYQICRKEKEDFQNMCEQLRQELQEYKENWDDLVELATKTSLRNVELDEQIGQLRKELNDCEKFRYTVFKRMGELNDEL